MPTGKSTGSATFQRRTPKFTQVSHQLIHLTGSLYIYFIKYSFGCQQPSQQQQPNSSASGATSTSQSQQSDPMVSSQSLSKFDSPIYDGPINFRALFWVDRGPILWSLQAFIAVICAIETILMQYLTYKVRKSSTYLTSLASAPRYPRA